LRTVASYVQLLRRRYQGRLEPDADEFIQFAVDGSVRMQNLIRDLLEFSRVGTRGRPFEPTDGGAVLRGVVAQLDATIAETGATIDCGPLPGVLADASQLGQIFQNLLTNAIKFRGEAPPVIRVSGVRDGRKVVFTVSDNGLGISPEFREKVFMLFQRLHPIGKFDGTGMGLAICKKIVERHGGRIWIESTETSGTTFRFTLPAAEETN
jgi:light-regulated signal transduction histidine kinase (bacteriophytochrome)